MRKMELAVLTVVLVMVATTAWAQAEGGRNYRQLSGFPFVLVSDEADDSSSAPDNYSVSDSLFDAVACGLRFRVNSTELQPSDPFIALYNEQLVPWLRSQGMELRQVFVKGAASPEGPYSNNVRLSRERTRRLIEFLNQGLGTTAKGGTADIASLVSSQSVTEDYGLLVKMMKQNGDADAERVSTVWQECQGDEACCKRRLMALDRGRLWQRMKEQYFPALRQARVVLWFARRQEKVQPEKRETIALDTTKVAGVAVDSAATAVAGPVLGDVHIELPAGVAATNSMMADTLWTRRHLVAARTNLLHDLLYVPQFGWAPGLNIQLEYYPKRGHYTLNAGYTHTTHRHWNKYKFFQLRDAQLELRRYFQGEGLFRGPYIGLYGEFTVYGIGFSKTKGWEGEGGGGGLSAGYVWRLNRKGNLRIEVSASLGFFYTRHDPYVYGNTLTKEEDGLYYYDYHGNAADFRERNHVFTWLGPTNAGVHITYDIIYRKKKLKNEE